MKKKQKFFFLFSILSLTLWLSVLLASIHSWPTIEVNRYLYHSLFKIAFDSWWNSFLISFISATKIISTLMIYRFIYKKASSLHPWLGHCLFLICLFLSSGFIELFIQFSRIYEWMNIFHLSKNSLLFSIPILMILITYTPLIDHLHKIGQHLLFLSLSLLLAMALIIGKFILFDSNLPKNQPNIILITLDTLRADHLNCYGYPRDTTPFLDQLAQNNVFYTHCFSNAPWTAPAHASIFTSMFPSNHGVHSFLPKNDDYNNVYQLDDEHITLAEILKNEGYQTLAIMANFGYLKEIYHLNQGFEFYDVQQGSGSRVPYRDAEEMNQLVIHKFKNQKKPFFLFLNYMDPHGPYDPPHPYDTLFPGKSNFKHQDLHKKISGPVLSQERNLTEEEKQHFISQYDGEIRYLDDQLSLLFEELKKFGLYDNSMIVITSDHGEYFGEHFLIEHSKDVYQPVLHVPLIIKYPHSQIKNSISEVIQSVDIMPLILNHLKINVPSSIKEMWDNNTFDLSENYFTRQRDLLNKPYHQRFERIRRAIFQYPWKLIWSSDGQHELYQLIEDPSESINLWPQSTQSMDLLNSIESWIKNLITQKKKETQAQPNKYDIEQLKALGYL